jgi:hypothetical protein
MNGVTEHYGVAHCQIVTETSDFDNNNGKIRPENESRLPDGKFGPGNTLGGRPKGSGLVSEAIKQALRDGKAEEVKETLFKLVDSADRDSVRLAAISEVIDRSEGKAVQNVRHAGVFMVMAPGAEALAALDAWAEDE